MVYILLIPSEDLHHLSLPKTQISGHRITLFNLRQLRCFDFVFLQDFLLLFFREQNVLGDQFMFRNVYDELDFFEIFENDFWEAAILIRVEKVPHLFDDRFLKVFLPDYDDVFE